MDWPINRPVLPCLVSCSYRTPHSNPWYFLLESIIHDKSCLRNFQQEIFSTTGSFLGSNRPIYLGSLWLCSLHILHKYPEIIIIDIKLTFKLWKEPEFKWFMWPEMTASTCFLFPRAPLTASGAWVWIRLGRYWTTHRTSGSISAI